MTSPTHSTVQDSGGEVFGYRVLYAAIVIGAALLLAGVIWQPAPDAAPVQQAQAALTAQA
ncbi:MAG TPA: hypothetical protein VMH86_17740 [Rhizomicrobium sp.]|nr:hypothetical protein [Rhizomicrobium sp.]